MSPSTNLAAAVKAQEDLKDECNTLHIELELLQRLAAAKEAEFEAKKVELGEAIAAKQEAADQGRNVAAGNATGNFAGRNAAATTGGQGNAAPVSYEDGERSLEFE